MCQNCQTEVKRMIVKFERMPTVIEIQIEVPKSGLFEENEQTTCGSLIFVSFIFFVTY